LTRFDASTKEAFYNLYTKIDPTILPVPEGMDKPIAGQQPVAAAPIAPDTNYAINA